MKPILPLVKAMYGEKGVDLHWEAMHGQGPLALKYGREYGFGGVPFASAFVDQYKGLIIVPDDWRETYTSIDREMLRVSINDYRMCKLDEMSYLEFSEFLRKYDAWKWLKEWNRPDRAIYYGLTVDKFKDELIKEWRDKWPEIEPPIPA